MNLRFLVNKAIALLNFGQTQVVVSFRFDVLIDYLVGVFAVTRISVRNACFVFFFLSLMMRICALIEIEFFSYAMN